MAEVWDSSGDCMFALVLRVMAESHLGGSSVPWLISVKTLQLATCDIQKAKWASAQRASVYLKKKKCSSNSPTVLYVSNLVMLPVRGLF